MALIEMLAIERPVAQSREIARLFIPKFPAPLDLSDAERNARWLNWLLFVRRFAALERFAQVRLACRVEATVRRWESPVLEGWDGNRWLDAWRRGLRDGLTRAPLVHPDFLMDVAVRYEALPADTPLEERPREEGVEIIFYEEEGL